MGLPKLRLSKKLVLLSGGCLFLLGVSGTAALVLGGGGDEEAGSCKTLYEAEFQRAGEDRLLAVVRTTDTEPSERVRTGLRIARHLAETRHADLVIVQVTDNRGPDTRAKLRGEAIGVEVAHAPHGRTLATMKPWEVRYVDTRPTVAGLYYGPRVDMSLGDIETAVAGLAEVTGCDGDAVEAAAGGSPEKAAPAAGH